MEGIPARGPYVLSKKVSERVRGWTLRLTETLMSWTPREWQFSILLWREHKSCSGIIPEQCQWKILLTLTLNNGSEHYLTMFARLEIEVRIISCFSVSSSFLLWIVFLQERPVLPVGMATIDLDQFVASVDYLLSLTKSWVQLYKL